MKVSPAFPVKLRLIVIGLVDPSFPVVVFDKLIELSKTSWESAVISPSSVVSTVVLIVVTAADATSLDVLSVLELVEAEAALVVELVLALSVT